MRYEHREDLGDLLQRKLITKRGHPSLPLWVYNYTAGAQALPIKEWPEALKDCRGLILDEDGEVVGRPFRKFWNYEQVLDEIPSGKEYTIWEKVDGSLGIVCNYQGRLVVSTRGSFESEQAVWAKGWLEEQLPGWVPLEGMTYLAEIVYPENRIVVDYGDVHSMKLLAVMGNDGVENLAMFHAEKWDKAQGFPLSMKDIAALAEVNTPNAEGFVIRWSNGFRAKIKFEEYKRLHRLITQVSTRSIWELLRAGTPLVELRDRVPEDFRSWVDGVKRVLEAQFDGICTVAVDALYQAPKRVTRKEYAEWAKQQSYPHLQFALYDHKPIEDMIWKMIEPKWETPFRREVEG